MNGQKAKRNISTGPRLSIFVGVILVTFLVVQAIGGMMNGIGTVKALRVTAESSFTANGWFFRDEILVQGVSSETVKHIVHNGEKVQKNAALAVVYTDTAALEASQKIALLNDEINLLSSAMQTSSNGGDASKLDQQIASQIAAISSRSHKGIVAGIESDTASLRNLCLRRSAGELDGTTLSAQMFAMTTERDALERQLVGRSTTIASPASGFFSQIVDGFEDKLTTESIGTLTLDEFSALDEFDMSQAKNKGLGKVVGSFRWYFVVSAPLPQMEGISRGSSLRLRFSQADEDIDVTVEDIRREKDSDSALLILSGMDITPELVTARFQSAEIIRTSYTGIRVPKAAVKIQVDPDGNQQQGVFILTGSVSRFKKIEVLYEADTYYVVKQGISSEDTGLVAGDNIIVKARGLEDLKVIK